MDKGVEILNQYLSTLDKQFAFSRSSDFLKKGNEEAEMGVAEERFRDFADLADDMVFELDEQFKFYFVNNSLIIKTGYSPGYLQSRKFWDIVRSDYKKSAKIFFESFSISGTCQHYYECPLKTKNNDILWVGLNVRFSRRAEQIMVTRVAAHELTERKLSPVKLNKEPLVKSINNSLNVGVFRYENEKGFTYVNQAFAKLMGASTCAEIMEDHKYRLFDLIDRAEELQRKIKKMGFFTEEPVKVLKKNEDEFDALLSSTLVINDQKQECYDGTLVDITTSAFKYSRTFHSSDQFKELLNYSPLASLIIRGDGRIVFVSNTFRNLFSLEHGMENHLLEKCDFFIEDPLHSTDLVRHVHGALNGESLIARNLKLKGKVFESDNGMGKDVDRSLFNAYIFPFNEPNAGLNQVVLSLEDITEQRRSQEIIRNKNEEIYKISNELDQFMYRASHDLRAPICSVLGLVHLMKQDSEDDHFPEYLNMIESSVFKLDGFVKDLINFSRNSHTRVASEKVNLGHLIEEVYEDLRYMKDRDKIKFDIQVIGQPCVETDTRRLKIVLLNLISNAIKHHDLNQNTPYIEVLVHGMADKVYINVEDNGPGISKESKDKVFNMFYRANTKATGSGLGLYIVKETVDKLGGHVSLVSSKSGGSKFIVELPYTS
ncbi:MAG: PAS domain-containing sensor histidine kinase [Bacteroidota bacterium]